MANPEHLAILKKGVEVWNEWRQDFPEIRPNLRSCDLQHENLQQVDFSHTELSEADLSNAHLMFADFSQSNLTYAVVAHADAREANFRQADLSSANASGSKFCGAVLSGTRFIWTTLANADFTEAEVGWCVFADVGLTLVAGLLTVEHTGPSTIGTDTLRRCRGKVPREFLRGAGMPDSLIEDAFQTDGALDQFRSCFISYSTNDAVFADRLHADLQKQRCPLLVRSPRHSRRQKDP